jgi:hypothetical protein
MKIKYLNIENIGKESLVHDIMSEVKHLQNDMKLILDTLKEQKMQMY